MSKTPPPPPKKKGKPRKAPTADISLPTTAKQALFRGMFVYVGNPGMSLRQIWEHARMEDDDTSPYLKECISWFAFSKAAARGKWYQRRETHWRDIEARVLAQLKTTAIQKELEEIGVLEGMQSLAVETAHSGEAQPKSLEGLLGAIVALDKRLSAKRDRIYAAAAAAGVDTEDAPELPEAPSVDATYTDDEVEWMAIQLAKRRAGLIEDKSHGEG